MTTTTSNRKNVGSIATTRLASKSNSSQGLDAERRDVFRTLAVNALAVSTLTLCSPKLNVLLLQLWPMTRVQKVVVDNQWF